MKQKSKLQIAVIQTGTANMASVLNGLKRAGTEPFTTDDPEKIIKASGVVLPGVGAFAPAMRRLKNDGLDQVLLKRIKNESPTLCICLGLQLLFEGSEENPGVEGIGVLPGIVKGFPEHAKSPQIGWNRVEPDEGCKLIEPGYAYFANSFYAPALPGEWSTALTDHSGPFISAFERVNLLACQFHPELSGAWGLDLLRMWLNRVESSTLVAEETEPC